MTGAGLTQRVITIEIPGKPTTKQRPRFGQGRAYKPQKEKMLEAIFKAIALEHLQAQGLTKPISSEYIITLSMIFVFPIPKSYSKKKTQAIVKSNQYVSTPDLDNLIKFVKDALNGVLYEDDRQVWSYSGCRKIYGEEPRTVIIVSVEKKGW